VFQWLITAGSLACARKIGNEARYRALIVRLRSMLKTRFNAVLSRIVRLHAPAELVVERLNFCGQKQTIPGPR